MAAVSSGQCWQRTGEEVKLRTAELEEARAQVKTLRVFPPNCSSCKKIRDDPGCWDQLEAYITEYSEAEFSHSPSHGCAKKFYPEYFDES